MMPSLMDLVGLVYDSVQGPDRLTMLLRTLQDRLGAQSAQLLGMVSPGQYAQLASIDVPVEALHDYSSYYHQHDIWGREIVARRLQERPLAINTAGLVDARTLGRSIFYNEFLAPLGHRQALALTIEQPGGQGQHVLVAYRDGDPFTAAEEGLLNQLAPHLAKADQLRHRLQTAEGMQGLAQAAMEPLAFGVLVLDEEGRLLLANRQARTLIAEAAALQLQPGGWVRPAHPALRPAFARMVAETARLAEGKGLAVSPVLRLPLGLDRQAADGVVVMACPLPASMRASGSAERVMLYLHDGRFEAKPPAERLRLAFGLTPAEARVLDRLLAGDDVAQVAEALRVRPSTVRTHLKNLFVKMDCSRQSELLRKAQGLAVIEASW